MAAPLAAAALKTQELSAKKTSLFDNFNDNNVACHR